MGNASGKKASDSYLVPDSAIFSPRQVEHTKLYPQRARGRLIRDYFSQRLFASLNQRRMTVFLLDQSPQKYGTGLGLNLPPLDQQSDSLHGLVISKFEIVKSYFLKELKFMQDC